MITSARVICLCLPVLLSAGGALAQPRFEDHTARLLPPLDPMSGVIVADANNDGRADLLLVSAPPGSGATLLEAGEDDRFADRTHRLPEPFRPWGRASISLGRRGRFADFDHDSDLDLVLPVRGGVPGVLRNDGRRFVDASRTEGQLQTALSDEALWCDCDVDGGLDLFVGDTSGPDGRNRFYRGDRRGRFEDATVAVGLDIAMHPENGGSDGGLLASDFDGDGWPDLYVGGSGAPDRLFMGGPAGFRAARVAAIDADTGPSLALLAADIDADGDLDVVKVSGQTPGASGLRINDGGGEFRRSDLPTATLQACVLLDMDNDGDLDLLDAGQGTLFVSDGGSFSPFSGDLGLPEVAGTVATLDVDLDGAQDLVIGDGSGLHIYRNRARGAHWLRVIPVGDRNNRDGIGAHVVVETGDFTRHGEIRGGTDPGELMAHFGLGPRADVERVSLHWPSGHSDVIAGVSVDETIYIFEGRTIYTYFKAAPARWHIDVPESLVVGRGVDLELSVWPALEEPKAGIDAVVADLSALGGAPAEPFISGAGGTWSLRTHLSPPVPGRHEVRVVIEQSTLVGHKQTWLSRTLSVQPMVPPQADLLVLGENAAPGWQASTQGVVQSVIGSSATPWRGESVIALHIDNASQDNDWSLELRADDPIDSIPYAAVYLAMRLDDAVAGSGVPALTLSVNNRFVDLLASPAPAVVLGRVDWQVVRLPLVDLQLDGPIHAIFLRGNLRGTIYVDELGLLAPKTSTAVEKVETTVPGDIALLPGFPNPFNSGTILRVQLAGDADVRLWIFDSTGQRVRALHPGAHAAGLHRIRWDGTDDSGHLVGNGVYFVQLLVGGQRATGKLTLLR